MRDVLGMRDPVIMMQECWGEVAQQGNFIDICDCGVKVSYALQTSCETPSHL